VLDGKPDPLRPADKVQAQVTAAVSRVLMEAMAQSAAQRPPTAASMRKALREAASQSKNAFIPPALRPVAGSGARESNTQMAGATTGELASDYQLASAAVLPATIVQPALPIAKSQPLRMSEQPLDSVVTRVRPPRLVAAPERQLSRGMIGILASVMLLLAVAVAVYTFTRKSPTSAPIAQPGPSSTDPLAQTPTQAAPERVENQSPARSPSLYTEPSSARTPASGDQPADSSSNPTTSRSNSQAEPATVNSPTTAQPQNTPNTAAATSSPQLTPEAERALKADEIRRQRSAQDQEDMRRQREEMERERQQQQENDMRRREPPPPPPGGGMPPPPRRDGPRPF
jgi:hypothetical protein